LRVNGYGYLEVSERDIASLKARQELGEFDLLQRGETRSIHVGQLVFVVSGPLADRQGT
jgi:hypothetical protein